MIDPAQIPQEVVETALRAYSGNSCECGSCRKAVIRTVAAALAAWPGAYTDQMSHEAQPKRLILPLPQEARDGA